MKKLTIIAALLLALAGKVCAQGTGITVVPSSASSSGAAPSSAYTFSVSAGTVTASPNASSLSTFTGSDVCVVFNQVTAALATVGGRLFFKNGIYNCNSLTNDATTGCSNFDGSGKQLSYAMVFPSNALASAVQWLLEGESAPVWLGESLAVTVNNAGVIFNITPTAVASVTANNILAGFWQKSSTNCTVINPGGQSNDLHFKNMSLRFPTNQRGNEIAFAAYYASNVEYENVVADFNLPYNTIATGSAPAAGSYGSFGLTTTASGAGGWQFFKNTFATGYSIGYDFQSEHIFTVTATAIYSNNACEFGRDGTPLQHLNVLHNFEDQENGAGCIFGPQVQAGTYFDISLEVEVTSDANWYSTARNQRVLWSESTPGNAGGVIRYQVFLVGGGITVEIPAANLFSTGGQNFQVVEGSGQTNLALNTGTDTFTRPNSANLGTGWITAFGSVIGITSNAATTASAAGGAIWQGPQVKADQFSQATINTVDANGVAMMLRGNAASQTYYDYSCTPGTSRIIRKRIAGTFTTLFTNAGATCAVGDTFKFVVVGSTLWGYFTHTGVVTVDGPVTDTAITSGFPGIIVGAPTDSWVTWTGGNVPMFSTTASLFSQPVVGLTYNTLTNCASSAGTCASAPTGSVSIAAAATTVTVATTVINANSVIILSRDDTLGTKLGVTCNTATAAGDIKASTRTAGTSFVITVQNAPVTNPLCLNYWIVN